MGTNLNEEKLGAHAQEHHIAVDKLLFIPSREEARLIYQIINRIITFYWELYPAARFVRGGFTAPKCKACKYRIQRCLSSIELF